MSAAERGAAVTDPLAGGGGTPASGAADARRTRRRTLSTLAIAFGGLAVWLAAGAASSHLRAAETERGLVPGRRSEGEAVASVLGGFRGLASDFLWLRAIQMKDEGRFDEITLLCRLILDLQPRFAGVWRFLAWNLAYNLAYDSNTPRERWQWIRRGMDLLEDPDDGGIARNPTSWHLPWELGHIHFFRVSRQGRDAFYRHYQEEFAHVPDWCRDEFEFVDQGLWVVGGAGEGGGRERRRLYMRSFPAGRVTLGAASGGGGYPTRAARMYAVIVSPAGALAGASRVGATGARGLGPVPLVPGAPLYLDAPERVSGERAPPVHVGEADEPPVPDRLRGAALVPLPDADRVLDAEDYLELELSRPAEVWLAWPADETRSFELARGWIEKAEKLSRGRFLMVSRLRVHCLVETGEWERAYEEFRELMRTRPSGDKSVPDTFSNFLRYAVYRRFVEGDSEGVAEWHRRLRENFPSWRMSAVETAKRVAEELGVPLPGTM